jgi:hypothetical protein
MGGMTMIDWSKPIEWRDKLGNINEAELLLRDMPYCGFKVNVVRVKSSESSHTIHCVNDSGVLVKMRGDFYDQCIFNKTTRCTVYGAVLEDKNGGLMSISHVNRGSFEAMLSVSNMKIIQQFEHSFELE